MATSKIPTMLRLPEEMHLKIKKLAIADHRSMNMEIEYAIAKYISEYEAEHGTIDVDTDVLYQ